MKSTQIGKILSGVIIIFTIGLSSCAPEDKPLLIIEPAKTDIPAPTSAAPGSEEFTPRPIYPPGELVDYIAQPGDTLPGLALHFNTQENEIRSANPIIPEDATTLPPGFPMKIPIFYSPLWGNPFHIIPDNLFVDGPDARGFNTQSFVQGSKGWLKNFQTVAGGNTSNGAEMVDHVAGLYSIAPRLLLAILEYQTGALSKQETPPNLDKYPLGLEDHDNLGLYQQLVSTANILNNGYYGWRTGSFKSFEHQDGKLERPDPWQNASTVSLSNYFARTLSAEQYSQAVTKNGFYSTYKMLFGDPWADPQEIIPGSLQQPPLTLPFQPGKTWAYTGGPHPGWGEGEPFAAIDFAPPGTKGGCAPSVEWVTAIADGDVVRTGTGILVLDLDGDHDERTGWVIFYLHLAGFENVNIGDHLKTGDPIGHPSCEGGNSTGTHVHIARKYNGEWIPAGGPLAFNLEGWKARNGSEPYLGTLEKFTAVIRACTCSDRPSQLQSTYTH